jgi:GNAT superfamily N-acetyltransferase
MPGDPAETIVIRLASAEEIPEIIRQRRRMYEDMQYRDAGALAEMARVTAEYLAKAMPEGSFQAWLAWAGERSVGGAAVILTPWPAHPYDLECRRATILNVYTDPEYRRRGIARRLMETMIAWCKSENLASVFLHASEDGRHLYESLGFKVGNEMRMKLR